MFYMNLMKRKIKSLLEYFLQNYRPLETGLEKAVLPLFPMLLSSKSGANPLEIKRPL